MSLIFRIFLPGETQNPLNSRKHWRVVWAHSADWRKRTASAAIFATRPLRPPIDPKAPKRITLFVHRKRLLDSTDGLRASLKPVVDGLCPHKAYMRKGRLVSQPGANIIHSDAPKCGHDFVYDQVVDRMNVGVWITVEYLPAPAGSNTPPLSQESLHVGG